MARLLTSSFGEVPVERTAAALLFSLLLASSSFGANERCVACHKTATPGIVTDWELSKHSHAGVGCSTCHGVGHSAASDAGKALIPTPDVCGACHLRQVEQFKRGKHAFAWAAMKAMPTIHHQPVAMVEGMKGCGGCHKIGLKTEAEIRQLERIEGGFGVASCDACHTRHTFSVEEARQPQACQTCHMGFDHPQWEMYEGSKHGVRYRLEQMKILPEAAAAPTCRTCHMPGGEHGVRTAWGFLAVRLPLPDDPEWAADQTTILQALGVLDPEGKPTARFEAVKQAQMARLTEQDWQQERERMLKTCEHCHSASFADQQLKRGDEMIRASDHAMASAIQVVAGLYKDRILQKPAGYTYPFPDLLTLHNAPSVIEQKLFVMFLEHRMRAFQGTFHASPDYALWYGWSKMERDLVEIKELAAQMRREHQVVKPAAGN
jgi:hydroxylamine dehydrogenase